MENDVEWRRIAFRSFLNDEWFCRNAAEVVVKRGRGGACVPASAPRKGASIVRRVGRRAETQCLHMEVHYSRMETPLRGRSGGHTGTAPTIPNTCKQAASPKPKGFLLAETLQAPNRSGMRLQKRCKCQTVREFICRNAASAKPFGNSFAGTLQTPNRSGMHLQKRCKHQTVREFICRNAASVKPFGNSFAEMLRAFEKVE